MKLLHEVEADHFRDGQQSRRHPLVMHEFGFAGGGQEPDAADFTLLPPIVIPDPQVWPLSVCVCVCVPVCVRVCVSVSLSLSTSRDLSLDLSRPLSRPLDLTHCPQHPLGCSFNALVPLRTGRATSTGIAWLITSSSLHSRARCPCHWIALPPGWALSLCTTTL